MGFVMLLAGLLSKSAGIQGQEEVRNVLYTPDYRFSDGIFLSFEMVKSNSPVSKGALLIAADYYDPDFFMRILTAGEIRYKDESGKTGVIRREDVFAFSVDGRLGIIYRGRFSRDVLIGTISLFTFRKQKYYGDYTGSDDRGSGEKDYERLKYSGSNTCLLNFTSGKVLRLNRRNLGLILSTDKPISEEYRSLSRRWSKAQMFYFIGKFNEKNPLYLPEY